LFCLVDLGPNDLPGIVLHVGVPPYARGAVAPETARLPQLLGVIIDGGWPAIAGTAPAAPSGSGAVGLITNETSDTGAGLRDSQMNR
jgi:hypothetical protein